MSPPRAEVPPVRVPSDVRPRRALPCGPRRPFARSTSQLRAPRRAPARTVRPRAAVRVLWWGRAMRGPRGARCTRRSRVTPRRSPACRAIRLLRRSRRRRPRAGAQAPLRRMVLPLLRAGLLCTVHPRAGGSGAWRQRGSLMVSGSSPRWRERLERNGHGQLPCGVIPPRGRERGRSPVRIRQSQRHPPAWAGARDSRERAAAEPRSSPRVGGSAWACGKSLSSRRRGSSPRWGGTQSPIPIRRQAIRCISPFAHRTVPVGTIRYNSHTKAGSGARRRTPSGDCQSAGIGRGTTRWQGSHPIAFDQRSISG